MHFQYSVEWIHKVQSCDPIMTECCLAFLRSGEWGGGVKVPALTSLDIQHCEDLTSLPRRFKDLTGLRTLNVYNCPAKHSMLAALKSQLKAQGCKIVG